MERKLQERMIGAGVLILLLVILGPVVLDGDSGEQAMDRVPPGERGEELRSHTFRLDAPAVTKAPQTDAPAPPPGDPRPRVPVSDATAVVPAPDVEPPPEVPAPPASVDPPRERPVARTSDNPPRVVAAPANVPAPVAGQARSATVFVVQLGTFGQKENAERLTASLRKEGFDAFVSPTTREGKSLYRVRVGPAAPRVAAEELAARLAGAGHKGQLVAQ